MKAEFINPFITSLDSVFGTMLDTTVKRRQPRVATVTPLREGKTLTSIIGISGEAHGVVALIFPQQTALKLASKFLGGEYSVVNEEVTDALAEVANMVGGSAKAKFDLEPPPDLSLPTVIEGSDYRMKYPSTSVWVEVPFESSAGEFIMDVSFGTE